MANADMCLEAARKAFPDNEELRVAYMLGFNEGYDKATEQPSLPSNLDEAARTMADECLQGLPINGEVIPALKDIIKIAVRYGAKWMAGQEVTSIKGYLNRNIDDELVLSLSPNYAEYEWLLFKSDLFPNIKSGDEPRCVNIIIKEQV